MKSWLPFHALFVLGFLATTPGTVEADADNGTPGFDPSPYPHSREIGEIGEIGEINAKAGLFRIDVDASLYGHSGPDFVSLRLAKQQDGAWIELPWVSRVANTPSKIGPFFRAHRIESLDETPEGTLEMVVSFSEPWSAPFRLEIDTPLADFEKEVSIAIPGPDETWTEVVADGVIFDHRRFLDFRHTSVHVPATESNKLRIRIAEATDVQRSRLREITRTVGEASGQTVTESGEVETRKFRIDGLRFVPLPDASADEAHGRQVHELAIIEQTTQSDGSTSILLESGYLPLDYLILKSGDRNFRRPVSVQVPKADETWETIHRTYLHRYEVGDFRDESLILRFPETRSERLRLLVENGTNIPVTFSSINGKGTAYEIFFLAEPGDHPVLFLGGSPESLTNPPLDSAAIQAAIQRHVTAAAITAGEVTPNPEYRADAAGPPGPGLLDSKPALWSIIALAVAVLIAVLYQALRKIEEKPSDETEGGSRHS